MASTLHQILSDQSRVPLRVEVRDKSFRPVANATVEAHIVGPGGSAANISLVPAPLEDGAYVADWSADKPGSYMAEIVARQGSQEAGRDVLVFRREDGVAENFHLTQNRELLEKLAEQTGGHYYPATRASRLPEDISYSEAGITTRETKDLWDMPVVFLAALLLRGTEELTLPKRRGLPALAVKPITNSASPCGLEKSRRFSSQPVTPRSRPCEGLRLRGPTCALRFKRSQMKPGRRMPWWSC
jgi:hypothetical protein